MRKHKYREKQWSEEGYFFDLLYQEIILDSSMVERTAVNRDVVGSSPTRGALVRRQMPVDFFFWLDATYCAVCSNFAGSKRTGDLAGTYQ